MSELDRASLDRTLPPRSGSADWDEVLRGVHSRTGNDLGVAHVPLPVEVGDVLEIRADSDANHTRIVAPLTRDRQWPLRTVRGQRCVTLGELPVDLAS